MPQLSDWDARAADGRLKAQARADIVDKDGGKIGQALVSVAGMQMTAGGHVPGRAVLIAKWSDDNLEVEVDVEVKISTRPSQDGSKLSDMMQFFGNELAAKIIAGLRMVEDADEE